MTLTHFHHPGLSFLENLFSFSIWMHTRVSFCTAVIIKLNVKKNEMSFINMIMFANAAVQFGSAS